MNAMTHVRHVLNHYVPLLMLAVFSSASIAFGMAWSLHALVHPLV